MEEAIYLMAHTFDENEEEITRVMLNHKHSKHIYRNFRDHLVRTNTDSLREQRCRPNTGKYHYDVEFERKN